MSPLVTDTLEIDTDAVKRGAIKMARQSFASQAARVGSYGLCSTYIEHLGNALRWHRLSAQNELELEAERARRRALSDLGREREDLIIWRDRIDNPLTRPTHFGSGPFGNAACTSELARIDTRLAEIAVPLSSPTHKEAA